MAFYSNKRVFANPVDHFVGRVSWPFKTRSFNSFNTLLSITRLAGLFKIRFYSVYILFLIYFITNQSGNKLVNMI